MSFKTTSMKNGSINDPQWVKANNLIDTSVKLAGEEAKDRLYEPKHKKKLVRVLTVIAYVFFVSLAAIMLSLYYMFLWNGDAKILPKYAMQKRTQTAKCGPIFAEMQQQIKMNAKDYFSSTATTPTEELITSSYYESDNNDRTSILIQKLISSYPYEAND